jgi:hypothetical protein
VVGDENILKQDWMMIAQLSKFTKSKFEVYTQNG